jgi:anti-sigma regulatory factor (Ser/Thr protein kinase)
MPHHRRFVACAVVAEPGALAEARRAITALDLPRETRATLALLVSELVANSLRHSRAPFGDPVEVNLTDGTGRLRLAVRDGGHGFKWPVGNHRGPFATRGQGLAIVEALSETWGVHANGNGCTVWCEVAAEEDA